MDADIEAVQQSGRVAIGFCTPDMSSTNEEEAPATEEENMFTHVSICLLNNFPNMYCV